MSIYKKVLKVFLAFGAIVLIAIVMLLIYNHYKPHINMGSKEIVVEVVIPKEENQEIKITTDAGYLGEALEEQGLVKGSESDYGLFITEVSGRLADDSKQEWWCITKAGEYLYTGADETPIANGEHYELTLTSGY